MAGMIYGLRRDRVARAIKRAGGSDIFKQADKKVAELLGVTPRAVASWRYKGAGVDPPHEKLQRIAEAAGVGVGWLYGEGGDEMPSSPGANKEGEDQ